VISEQFSAGLFDGREENGDYFRARENCLVQQIEMDEWAFLCHHWFFNQPQSLDRQREDQMLAHAERFPACVSRPSGQLR